MSTSRQYELVYILSPDSSDQDVADLHQQVAEIVARFQGTIDSTEQWGRRKLAYEIARHGEGIYVIELITGPTDLVKELDRRLKVVDRVIRHLVIRIDEELEVVERAKARRQAQTAKRRAARGLAADAPASGASEEAGPQPEGAGESSKDAEAQS